MKGRGASGGRTRLEGKLDWPGRGERPASSVHGLGLSHSRGAGEKQTRNHRVGNGRDRIREDWGCLKDGKPTI